MKILVLAGGFDQIALIEEFKKRGNIVYLADYNAYPPAAKVADKHFQISTLDVESIYDLAKNEAVDLITTACTDQALLTVAIVSEKLGLPCYISSATAMNVTNKTYMKQKFREWKIPSADFLIIGKEDSSIDPGNFELKFPVVVKPCDCNSSKGVEKVVSFENLNKVIHKSHELSRSEKAIVEEYKEGIELSIDAWKDPEGVKIIGISQTNKIEQGRNCFTIYQSVYPAVRSDAVRKSLLEIAEKVYAAFDLDDCPLLMQVIINGENVSVVEISARMGGGSKYKLIEYMTGIDIMKIYVNRVLGDVKQVLNPKWSEKQIEINYVYAESGVIKEIKGIDALLSEKIVKEIFIYKKTGDLVKDKTTSTDRVFGYLLEDNTEDELNQNKRKAVKSFDIIAEGDKSIIIRDYQ